MRIHRTLTRFITWMAAVSDKQTKDVLQQMQQSLEYCQEENRVLREVLQKRYGCKQLHLTNSQRRRLGRKGYAFKVH